jgi:tetratricopeptide (TPR) repeat protein
VRLFLLLLVSSTAVQAQVRADYPATRREAVDAYRKGQYDRALTLYRAGVDLAEGMHSPVEIAKCYADIGQVHYLQGKMVPALEAFHTALEKVKPVRDPGIEAIIGSEPRFAYRWKGDLAEALTAGQTSLALFRELGDVRQIAGQSMNNGLIVRAQGDLRAGVALFHDPQLDVQLEGAGCSRDLVLHDGVATATGPVRVSHLSRHTVPGRCGRCLPASDIPGRRHLFYAACFGAEPPSRRF